MNYETPKCEIKDYFSPSHSNVSIPFDENFRSKILSEVES